MQDFKLLIVCSGNSSFVSPFIQEQANALMSLGIQVEIFLIKGKGFIGYLKNYNRLLDTINYYKPNLIHAHYGLSGLLANLQRKVDVITTFHGSDIWVFRRNRFLSRIANMLSVHSIVVDKKMASVFKSKKVPTVIPCGVDMHTFYPISDKKSIKGTFSAFTPEKVNILFSSRFDYYEKNYPLAKKAMSLLGDKFNLIELKGFSREEVNILLNKCDLALMTSISEGSPQFIKEAMATNTPIVSTNVGDVSWLIGKTKGCYITSFNASDVAEKIKLAVAFSKETKKTSGRERLIELKLSNDSVAKKILNIYKNVIAA